MLFNYTFFRFISNTICTKIIAILDKINKKEYQRPAWPYRSIGSVDICHTWAENDAFRMDLQFFEPKVIIFSANCSWFKELVEKENEWGSQDSNTLEFLHARRCSSCGYVIQFGDILHVKKANICLPDWYLFLSRICLFILWSKKKISTSSVCLAGKQVWYTLNFFFPFIGLCK